MRATYYARPLSVALLQVADIAGANRPERVAALQALIRIARSATSAPTVVAYFGENRVLLILPEHSEETAQKLLARIRARAEKEIYFPEGVEGLGRPLQESGKLLMAVAAVDSKNGSPEALLESAAAGLQS
jgi:GGDEF domain-containing protein